jgi:hypothetical protein
MQSLDRFGLDGYAYPRCFAEVCQRKGVAGASVRMYVKTSRIEDRCFELGAVKRNGGVSVRTYSERTCRSIYYSVLVVQWYLLRIS